MPRLGKTAAEIRPHYDAVVVGSGYGGGVAACRLARMGFKVAVLERGREYLPGDFPTNVRETQRETQIALGGKRLGSATALFDLRVGRDVHTLVGCGLGGTSLINANVCLNPDVPVLEEDVWPQAIRADHWLNVGFHRARTMLAPERLPEGVVPLKLKALDLAAAKFGRHAERVPLHIAFEDRINAAGVRQSKCTLCGDCMGGCNVGAKTTVHNTYLADAAQHGAELFTHANVRAIERAGAQWRVIYKRQDQADAIMPVRAVSASMVVLAAGTLGSSEILMRSRERGLAVSERLGKRFSTNADSIAFGYNNDVAVNAVGVGNPPRKDAALPGPAVAGRIDLRRRQQEPDRLVIVDAAVQSAVAALLPLVLPAGAILGTSTDKGLSSALEDLQRTAESVVRGAYRGAVQNTQVFLAVGHDHAEGELHFEHDRVVISWPNALENPVYGRIDATLQKAVAATGGTYIPNPVSKSFLGGNPFTVHPLGGCALASDRGGGVVDHKCRVFDADEDKPADAVHAGLFVCDGSIVPCSLGVHPLLTITALAERAMLLLARDLGRDLPADPLVAAAPREPRAEKPKASKGRIAHLLKTITG